MRKSHSHTVTTYFNETKITKGHYFSNEFHSQDKLLHGPVKYQCEPQVFRFFLWTTRNNSWTPRLHIDPMRTTDVAFDLQICAFIGLKNRILMSLGTHSSSVIAVNSFFSVTWTHFVAHCYKESSFQQCAIEKYFGREIEIVRYFDEIMHRVIMQTEYCSYTLSLS